MSRFGRLRFCVKVLRCKMGVVRFRILIVRGFRIAVLELRIRIFRYGIMDLGFRICVGLIEFRFNVCLLVLCFVLGVSGVGV